MVSIEQACVLNGYPWNLSYTASALRILQMTQGSLEHFSQRLMEQNMGTGMSFDTQSLLILAGQKAADPNIKLSQVKRRLVEMGDQGRLIVVTWAASEFCRTLLEMTAAQIQAAHPDPIDPEEDDGL